MLKLSYTHIVGRIHPGVPLCVLHVVAQAHDIELTETNAEQAGALAGDICATAVESIRVPPCREDWPLIARFVNINETWTLDKLTIAFNWLTKFSGVPRDPLDLLPQRWTMGLQSPANPLAVNVCVLYAILSRYHIPTTARTTPTQLERGVRLLLQPRDSVQRRFNTYTQHLSDGKAMITTLMQASHDVEDPGGEIIPMVPMELPPPAAEHNQLSLLYTTSTTVAGLQPHVQINTASGAIAMAAIRFSVDISRAKHPVQEYYAYAERKQFSDLWLRHWHQHRPGLFDLTSNFNPLFPQLYYSERTLTKLALAEGYSSAEINVTPPYELLQVAALSKTFYLGPVPRMTKTQTFVDIDEIDEVPEGQLLAYGVLGQEMEPVTISEMNDMLTRQQNFSDPFVRGSMLTPLSLNKLKRLTERLPSLLAATNLRETINIIRLNVDSDPKTKELVQLYQRGPLKQDILQALKLLLEASMYMRSWVGPEEPYVLHDRKADSLTKVSQRVSASIRAFEAHLEKMAEKSGANSTGESSTRGSVVGRLILDLPLVRQVDGGYLTSNDVDEGLTIGQRLEMVKLGEASRNIRSCVRLSSNWLASSAHKYLTHLGQTPPFTLHKLINIS